MWSLLSRSLRGTRSARGLVLVALLAALGACGKDEPTGPRGEGIMPDFALSDVNPNSATSGQAVSPRQHLGAISAWYFGTAT